MDKIQKLEEKETSGGVQSKSVKISKEKINRFKDQKDTDSSKIFKQEMYFESTEEKEHKINNIISIIAISSVLKIFISPLKDIESLHMGGSNFENIKWGFLLISLIIGFSLSFYLIISSICFLNLIFYCC